MASIEKELQ
jgi:hypothetical protein